MQFFSLFYPFLYLNIYEFNFENRNSKWILVKEFFTPPKEKKSSLKSISQKNADVLHIGRYMYVKSTHFSTYLSFRKIDSNMTCFEKTILFPILCNSIIFREIKCQGRIFRYGCSLFLREIEALNWNVLLNLTSFFRQINCTENLLFNLT